MPRYYHYDGLEPENLHAIPCPVCDGERQSVVGIDNGFSIQRCLTPGCGFVFVNPRPNDEQLAAFYAKYYDADAQVPDKWNSEMGDLFDECAEWVGAHAPDGEVLDVGCSFGHFLGRMERRGWRTVGIEPSPVAAEYAQAHLKGRIFPEPFERVDLEPARFDAVVSLYVLEHLSEPRAFVQKVHDLLKPGGLAIIRVPYTAPLFPLQRLLGRSLMYAPMHLNDFSPSTMEKLGTRVGFSRCEVHVGQRRRAHDLVENIGARILGGLGRVVEIASGGRAIFPLVGALSYRLYK